MSVRYSGLSLHLVDDDARLEPYLLLPSQTRQNSGLSPEERLWWAVLGRARDDLRGYGLSGNGRDYQRGRKARLALDAAE